MLVFECPFCNAKLQAAEERAADGILCVNCQATANRVHDPLQSAQPGVRRVREDDDNEDDDDAKPRATKASSGAGAAAAGAGMGIGMILLIVGGIGACCLCVPGILAALIIPAVLKVRDAAANVQAVNTAKMIAMACHAHNDTYKFFPSPSMQPPAGNSRDLSWRVSILPFMDQQPLFAQFDTNQGWQGPRNQPLLNRMPMEFASAAGAGKATSETKFQYFTGPNTLFPDPLTKVRVFEIRDGASNTFLFAEAATVVPWSKPADMVVGPGPLPLPEAKFIAAMADGTARMVNRRTASDEVLRQLINPNDGKFGPPGWGD
jgi:hypothetical protein